MGTKSAFGVALAVTALASGCGGSGQGTDAETYLLEPTRECLASRGDVGVDTKRVDFVASTALGGAMRARLATDNFVVVAFGDDRDEAARIEQAYREFAGKSIPIDDVLQRTKNVVLVWNGPPGAEEEDTVVGCLRGES
jgi:hypothetical protein